jgi:hypothetical protein
MRMIDKTYREGKLTLTLALKGKQLSYYNREDKMSAGATVTALVYQLSQAYNIGKNLTWDQAGDVAEAILRNYWHLKLAEIFLFIENAKQGKYGKSFDRLDMAVILEWLDKHCEEREVELERLHTQKKNDQEVITEGRDVLNAVVTKFPESAEKLKSIGSVHRGNPQKIEVDEESRDAKNKLILIQQLKTWFPKEMVLAYKAAEYAYDRWKTPCTVDWILGSRKIQILIGKMEQAKQPRI